MTTPLELEAHKRTLSTKGSTKALRSQGFIPAVVYGGSSPCEFFAIEAKSFKKIRSVPGYRTHVINVGEEKVLVWDIQFHPVTDDPVHVDFLRVEGNSMITLAVSLRFINEGACPGIKRGGVLNVVLPSLKIKAPAQNIPSFIEVDLTPYTVGQSIPLSALTLPEKVVVLETGNPTVATIIAPSGKSSKEETAS